MDRTQVIGLILIFGLIFAWTYNNGKQREAYALEQARLDSIAQVEENKKAAEAALNAPIDTMAAIEAQPIVPDSLMDSRLLAQYGVFGSNAKKQKEDKLTLENDKVIVTFSSQGGKITSVELKDHKKVTENEDRVKSTSPVFLMDNPENRFSYLLPVKAVPGGVIDTEELNFNVSQSGNTITFSAGTSGEFKQVYTLKEGYEIDYDIAFNDASNIYKKNEPVKMKWVNHLDRIELNDYFERFYSTVYFKEEGENSDYCNCRKSDTEEVDGAPIQWFSHVNQFFNTSIMANNEGFENGVFETKVLESDSEDLKIIESEVDIPSSAIDDGTFDMTMIAGPNEFNMLKSYGNDLEMIIPFGRSFFGSINRWVIRPLFNFFDNLVGNKGIAIILMIFLIKTILYPLTYKMLKSQAKMGALKPELAGLKEKYKDDPQTQQMETMKIYREYGVSPLGGCMPMLIQMPIWYALFRFFPASIGFRQQSFLWAHDLSSFDDLIKLPIDLPVLGAHLSLFTMLWVITQLVYTYYNTKHMDMSANPAMKYVQYFMPVMFLGFFNQYASGLTVYMFFSNLFNIGQTIGTKKLIFNTDKIRQQLMANKLKPKKKKSRFMQNIEDQVKKQQELQRKQQKKK